MKKSVEPPNFWNNLHNCIAIVSVGVIRSVALLHLKIILQVALIKRYICMYTLLSSFIL